MNADTSDPGSRREPGDDAPKNQQFATLNRFRREHQRVDVYLVSGVRLSGRIRSFDQYTMLIETQEGDAVVYHHAVSSIGRSMPRPRRSPREQGPRDAGAGMRDPRPRDFGADDSPRAPLRPRAPAPAPEVVVIRRRSRLIPDA